MKVFLQLVCVLITAISSLDYESLCCFGNREKTKIQIQTFLKKDPKEYEEENEKKYDKEACLVFIHESNCLREKMYCKESGRYFFSDQLSFFNSCKVKVINFCIELKYKRIILTKESNPKTSPLYDLVKAYVPPAKKESPAMPKMESKSKTAIKTKKPCPKEKSCKTNDSCPTKKSCKTKSCGKKKKLPII